jgi:hypothetical protein
MSAIRDLSICTALPLNCQTLVAIGWLEKDSEFETGDVSDSFYEKLNALCTSPWQPVVSAGFHSCSLCQFDGPRFTANLFVPYEGLIYAVPTAITHYIAAHWYKPPEIFVRAVLNCPEMRSMAYKKAILANGGRSLVNPSAA